MNNEFSVALDKKLCEILGIPTEVYDSLPGEDGQKFFTQEEYNDLESMGEDL